MGQGPRELMADAGRDAGPPGAAGAPRDQHSPEAARAHIAETRDEMAGTLDAIQEKLDPGQLKERARDEIRGETLGKLEPQLEDARRRARQVMDAVGEAVRDVGEKTASVAATAGRQGEQIAKQVRERATDTLQAATTLVHGEGAHTPDDGAPRLDGGSATLRDGAHSAVQATSAILRATTPATQAVIRVIRAYPFAATLLALGIGVMLGRALTGRRSATRPAATLPPSSRGEQAQSLIVELPA